MKCIFIYNPAGGNGTIEKKKEYILRELREKYEQIDVRATQCAGDMTKIARESVGKYDEIVFAGGDGSFNELLQGVADFEEAPVLGYIPSGTVNDVAHSLKIPKNVKKAVKIIKKGTPQAIDCMKVNDRYALYVATAGAFTSATYNTPQLQKKHVGRLAYGVEGIRHNLKFEPFSVACEGNNRVYKTEGCVLIAFINSKYVAGFKMNKRADLQDGEMEVAIVEQKKKRNIFQRIGALFAIAGLFLFGYRAKIRNVTHLKGSAFNVRLSDDIVWNFDGEKGISGSVRVEIVPKKVKILLLDK